MLNQLALNLYRNSPLHPRMSQTIARIMAKVQGERLVTRKVDGFTIELNTAHWIDSMILRTGTFEPGTTELVRRYLQPGMTFIDVGANIGWFTLIAAEAMGETGKVIAFEPSDWTFDRLCSQIKINNLDDRVELHRSAVGSTCGSFSLSLPCGYRLDGRDTASQQEVPVVTLDESLAEETPSLIKIDTDGAEIDIIEGAGSLIERCRPTIIFEIMGRTDPARVTGVVDALRDCSMLILDEQLTPVDDPVEHVRRQPGQTENLIACTPEGRDRLEGAVQRRVA